MIADLSIIVTNYNKPHKQLTECMDSIREQTVPPKEVILIDDCSDDPRAHAIATSIILPKNVGVAEARDVGVKMSNGRLLLFVDADDKLAPDFVQQCGKVIGNVDIAYTNLLLFGNIEKNKLIEAPKRLLAKHLYPKKCYIRVTSMMHRKVYEGLHGFRKFPVFEDWDFWLRAMCKGYTFARANTLLWYRQSMKSRNRLAREDKLTVISEITAPYKIKDDKLIEKEVNGKKKIKTS